MELEVYFIPPMHTGLLICHLPGADGTNPMELVNVTVGSNVNFMKKMRLRARRKPGEGKSFTMEGRLPRWRGDNSKW